MDLYERLCIVAEEKNWNCLVDVMPPKYFLPQHEKTWLDMRILAKLAEILTTPEFDISTDVQILLLKCLANCCVQGFKHKRDSVEEKASGIHQMYNALSRSTDDTGNDAILFPYEGIVVWCADYIVNSVNNGEDHSDERCKVLRYCVQFLVNFVNSACRIDELPRCLLDSSFKEAIVSFFASNDVALASAACLYVLNKLTRPCLPEGYYTKRELCSLAKPLIDIDRRGIDIGADTLIILIARPNWLTSTYDNLSIERKLYLLDIIHQDVRKTVYSENKNQASTNFPLEVIAFFSERFRKRSDLILKTVDSYLDGMEPAEIILLLDIIGVISSKESVECQALQSDKSLLINCIFLLKSLHMTGRAGENHFTPLEKLSDIAPSTQGTSSHQTDIQKHPAFGFKAGLIRAIGNLAHRHAINQELLRDTDAIPLLLDCCNIDARNPLIMQWTIFALRNVCENNPESQEIIRNCNKIGVVDNAVLREMGLKLHEGEDGKAIGILPLPTNE